MPIRALELGRAAFDLKMRGLGRDALLYRPYTSGRPIRVPGPAQAHAWPLPETVSVGCNQTAILLKRSIKDSFQKIRHRITHILIRDQRKKSADASIQFNLI